MKDHMTRTTGSDAEQGGGAGDRQADSVREANQRSARIQLEDGGGAGAAIAPGEQVIVLEASTSATKIGADMPLFTPNTSYAMDLDQRFFDQLASPTGAGFLDMLKPGGADRSDRLNVDGTELKGSKPQTATFTIRSARGNGAMRRPTNKVAFSGANNGVLNLARLASAYLSAVQANALAGNPESLTVVCHVTMGSDPKAEDTDARRETFLTTTPPSFSASANGTANAIMAGLLFAYGFGQEVDPSEATHPGFQRQDQRSANAQAQWVERMVTSNWKDRPTSRTFMKTPPTGVAAAIMADVAATAPQLAAASTSGDIDPRQVRTGPFYGKAAADDVGTERPHLDPGIKAKVIGEAKAIAGNVKAQLLAALPAGIASELPPEVQQYVPIMVERWTAAVEAAFAQVPWDFWYEGHFRRNRYSAAAPTTPTLQTGVVGNEEGLVHNELRLHRPPEQP